MYTPGYLQNKLMPTTEQAMTARRMADADGEARNARDFHAILLNMDHEFEEIYTHTNIRKVGITSFSWKIKSEDSSPAAQAKALEIRKHLKPCINKILGTAWERSLFGIYAAEIGWDFLSGVWIPKFLRKWSASDLNWNPNAELITEFTANGNQQSVFRNNREFYILAVDGDVPGGSLRRLIVNRVIAVEMLREWANYNTMIKGLISAKVGNSNDADEIQAVQNAISTIKSRNYAIYGEDVELEFKEMVSSGAATSFSDLMDRLDKRCAKVILGQANMSELPNSGGTQAALKVQRLITVDILLDDMKKCEEIINEQLLKFYWIKNTGSPFCPFEFEIEWQEEVNPEARAAVIDTMLRNKIPIRADEVYAATGFTKPDNAPNVFEGGSADDGF